MTTISLWIYTKEKPEFKNSVKDLSRQLNEDYMFDIKKFYYYENFPVNLSAVMDAGIPDTIQQIINLSTITDDMIKDYLVSTPGIPAIDLKKLYEQFITRRDYLQCLVKANIIKIEKR